MICENCGKNEARVHYTAWENNQPRELHVCQECAVEKGIVAVSNDSTKFSIQEPVIALIGDTALGSKIGRIECTSCGLLYSTFRETGRLGCSGCYDSFAEPLQPLLRRIHGNLSHVGRAPERSVDADQRREQVRALQNELEAAIHRENFERAAELRDRIRRLRVELDAGREPAESAGEES
ncbi:MAG: UvrB/UvrC motif-containing protein [Candidatus Eisenbacteria bacterium]|nr:UvrB/UvrC motif-containing protein [Candidatus Eisenbacteria bacterium]